MAQGNEEAIAVLELHRANLADSKTFEEYRDHHVAYVDLLIARLEADHLKWQATVVNAQRDPAPPPAQD